MADKKLQSLNDLSISIHLINKKYKIKEFIQEYRNKISEVNDLLRDELMSRDSCSTSDLRDEPMGDKLNFLIDL